MFEALVELLEKVLHLPQMLDGQPGVLGGFTPERPSSAFVFLMLTVIVLMHLLEPPVNPLSNIMHSRHFEQLGRMANHLDTLVKIPTLTFWFSFILSPTIPVTLAVSRISMDLPVTTAATDPVIARPSSIVAFSLPDLGPFATFCFGSFPPVRLTLRSPVPLATRIVAVIFLCRQRPPNHHQDGQSNDRQQHERPTLHFHISR